MEIRNIILCESATRHPDGTFSLLRGGIDNWVAQQFPVNISFTFVITVELSLSETNEQHTAGLDIIDEDGVRLVPQAKIQFSSLKVPHLIRFKNNIMGNINLTVPKPGRHSMDVSVDGEPMASYEFLVVKAQGQGSS
jgi:hypothetical protein